MDILIPLGHGTVWNNNELRYTLRSVEKHLTGVDKVFIIGQKPDWITNIIHIPHSDLPMGNMRSYNIYLKIIAGIRDERLSDSFLYMSDDHYLQMEQPFPAICYPVYYDGNIEDKLHLDPVRVPYVNVLNNTYRYLTNKGLTTKNFNVHCPAIYNKQQFDSMFPSPFPSYGFALKSIYYNSIGIPGVECPDLKINEKLSKEQIYELINNRPFFSIGNTALQGAMKTILQELYSLPSKYEL